MTPTPTARHTTDPELVLAAAGRFLRSRPVEHNLVLSLLEDRVATRRPGSYWWVESPDGEVHGVAFQSPLDFRATVTPLRPDDVGPLVAAVATAAPDLPGVSGEAGTAARFAGRWTEVVGRGAAAVDAQRLYVASTVAALPPVEGVARRATADDVDVVLAMVAAFTGEMAGSSDPIAQQVQRRRVLDGHVWVWERAGRVTCMASTAPAVAATVRVGPVYTPPEHRRSGCATSLVAHATAEALAQPGTDRCVLYTELGNATSNGIYRAIGYTAQVETLGYRFD